MNKKVKILAMYLPQYHEIPENSEFWGNGFTDWVSTKNAKSYFKGHIQPKKPFNNYYYDLSNKKDIKWQIDLAKKYSIYGFGIYHYWFSNKKVLLTKPAELILENKDLDIPFFFAWDNANWKRTWSTQRGNAWAPINDYEQKNKSKDNSVLIKYEIGNKDSWKKHFDYLIPYFLDKRYIKIENKPLFIIFNYSAEIKNMVEYWDILAKENGFDGFKIIYKKSKLNKIKKNDENFCYEPVYSGWNNIIKQIIFKYKIIAGIKINGPYIYKYDDIWKKILINAKKRKKENEWLSGFVSYDDTPRRGKEGRIIIGSSAEKFGYYLNELKKICISQKKEFILLTAWNEWGEGAILEPTEDDGYSYLEEVSSVINKE